MRFSAAVALVAALACYARSAQLGEYNEETATRLWRYCSLAVCDREEVAAWTCPECMRFGDTAELVRAYYVPPKIFGIGDWLAFTAVDHKLRQILLVSRGTVDGSFEDILTDIDGVILVPLDKDNSSKIQVGQGFKLASVGLRDMWRDDVESLLANKSLADYGFTIVGHSMGGAITTITAAAWFTSDAIRPRVSVVSFESPRSGNQQFAELFDGLFSQQHWRITNSRDPVVHLPPHTWPFTFHHVGNEYWYRSSDFTPANYLFCKNGEEKQCSDSVDMFHWNPKDHTKILGFDSKDPSVCLVPDSN